MSIHTHKTDGKLQAITINGDDAETIIKSINKLLDTLIRYDDSFNLVEFMNDNKSLFVILEES